MQCLSNITNLYAIDLIANYGFINLLSFMLQAHKTDVRLGTFKFIIKSFTF